MLRADIVRADNYAFLGRSNSNHWVVMDGSAKIGAQDGAARPKELILFAIGGCSAFDVEMILRKRRVALRDFRIEIEADEAPEHPMVFTAIRMTYYLEGDDIATKDVERAIHLSEETYCSVGAMLRKAVTISWVAKVNGEEVASSGA